MHKKEDMEKKFAIFISGISKNDRVAVMHHTDPDGVSSGVIMSKVIERTRGKKIDLRWNQGAGDGLRKHSVFLSPAPKLISRYDKKIASRYYAQG